MPTKAETPVSASNLAAYVEQLLPGLLLDVAHPVGSYYMSEDPTEPSVLFGGTWARVEGRFLFAADSDHAAGTTGGSNDAIVVAHTHGGTAASAGGHAHSATADSAGSHNHSISGGSHSHTASTNSTGAHTHNTTDVPHTTSSSPCGVSSASIYYYTVNSTKATSSAGSHSHTVSVSTSSSHSHTVGSGGSHSHDVTVSNGGAHSHSLSIDSAGSSGGGANMPAFRAVNVWRRTA